MDEEDSPHLNSLLNKINNWIENNHISYGTLFKNIEQVNKISEMSINEFRNLSYSDCIEYIFVLNQYLRHLTEIMSREKLIRNWSDKFLSFMIEETVKDPYLSREKKHNEAIRKNELCGFLNKLRAHCDYRILSIEPQIEPIEGIIKSLERKSYEQRSTSI